MEVKSNNFLLSGACNTRRGESPLEASCLVRAQGWLKTLPDTNYDWLSLWVVVMPWACSGQGWMEAPMRNHQRLQRVRRDLADEGHSFTTFSCTEPVLTRDLYFQCLILMDCSLVPSSFLEWNGQMQRNPSCVYIDSRSLVKVVYSKPAMYKIKPKTASNLINK